MIKKTIKIYRRRVPTYNSDAFKHDETVEKTTYWFLFIPIYSAERVINARI